MELVHLIGATTTVAVVVISGWVNISIKVAKLQVKVLELEKEIASDRTTHEKYLNKLEAKLDKLIDKIERVYENSRK